MFANQPSKGENHRARSGDKLDTSKITPELVAAIAARVYAILKREMQIERERHPSYRTRPKDTLGG